MTKRILFLVLACYSVTSNAQQGPFGYYREALLFSQSNTSYGSSARIQGVGGAQTALGGDLSSVASNPAGLGFFNRNVFALTPSLGFIATDTEYLGETGGSFKNNFNVSNIGTVITFTKGDYTNDKFKGGSLGISLSRMNGFHVDRNYEATNEVNSIIDTFLANAGQTQSNDLSGFESGAFDQYLINPTFDVADNITGYDSFILGFPIQSESIQEKGSHYQLNVAWGGNYDDRLYFGGGLGVHVLNYTRKRSYQESDFSIFDSQGKRTPDEFLNAVSIIDKLNIRGNGINLNVGAIFRPIDFMTLGVSYTSPTVMTFDEEDFFDLSADWKQGTTITETDETGNDVIIDISDTKPFQSNLFVSNYQLRTPAKLSIGTAFFVGKSGFLTGDIELIDYTTSRLKSNDFSESADNNLIEVLYARVVNIKAGGEYRFDSFRLRAGYAISPSAIKGSDLQERSDLTFGFGYRTSDYFLDFAVVNSQRKTLYSPYETALNQPIALSDIRSTAVSVTFGLTF